MIEVTSPLDLLFLTVANLLLCRRKGYLSLPEYDSSALCLGMKISKMPKVQFNIPGVGVKKKKNEGFLRLGHKTFASQVVPAFIRLLSCQLIDH